MVSIIVLLVMLLCPVIGHTATYYVATTGNNASDGSEATPWRTIGFAVSTMVAGDTTYVRGGTYSTETNITFSRTGTQANPIKLLNYPGESPIIDFQDKSSTRRMLILHASGQANAVAWVTIEGFEIINSWECMKWYNAQDMIFRNNWCHDNARMGILGNGGLRVLIDRNIFNTNGRIAECTAGTVSCNQDHGVYAYGGSYTITNNLFYNNQGYGIQQNGSGTSVYSATKHPSAQFAGAADWITANNTFAYSYGRAGMTVWGSLCTNSRIENNIFYENAVFVSSEPQGVKFTSTTCTGVTIRNNHFYATGSGGTTGIGSGAPGDLVSSGNVTNVSSPAFVNGGSNSLPASPDFSLTSASPAIGMARANEFARNATLTVGAFDTVGTPIGSITTNIATLIFPMSNAVPIQNLSATGATVGCTGTACPSSPTVSSVSRATATDSHVETTISGITANACVAANQTWTQSYNSTTAGVQAWTGNDNIGPYPGLHQRIFSFTSVALTNQCTGAAASSYPAGYHIYYAFEDGSGTNVNDGSANNLDGTFTNTPTWGEGKTGGGMVTSAGTTQHTAIPWGSGVNPYSTDLTIVAPVKIAVATENSSHYVFGPSHGTNQRFYVCSDSGTWRISYQAVTCPNTSASNLAVTSGWNHLVVITNSATHTATLYKNGVAGTGGASVTLTSYTLASNLTYGRVATLNSSGGTYDDFLVYLSIEDPVAIYEAFQEIATPPTHGTMAQAAVQSQGVYLDSSGAVLNFGPLNSATEVVLSGGIAEAFQIHCQAGSSCDQTAFRLVYARNQTAAAAAAAGTLTQVPNAETSDGVWMWGISTAGMNTGVTTTRLTGSCLVVNGATQVTAEQVPNVALFSDECIVLRYVVKFSAPVGTFFEFRLLPQSGLALAGGYAADARVTVVNPRASGIGF